MNNLHVYIHFPYCLYKCHYCDFNSYAWEKKHIPHTDYVHSILMELERRTEIFDREGTHFFPKESQIDSLFFGGGTPSLMRPQDVQKLICVMGEYFNLTPDCEITLESNPGTVNENRFREFKDAGINRISLGIQSFFEKNLKRFGRIHSADEAIQAIEAAKASGIKRLSADLIFGFPDQSFSEWKKDLSTILSHDLKHISCYALTAEPDTIYTRALSKLQLEETDADLMAEMQEATYEMTDKAGLSSYEISNFAKPGEESRHNLGYWRYSSFLGLGAGAWANFIQVNSDNARIETGGVEVPKSPSPQVSKSRFCTRTMNTKSPTQYMQDVQKGTFFTMEQIDHRTAMTEFLMMGLRLKEGISHNDFERRFGESLGSVYGQQILQAVSNDWLKDDGCWIRPTMAGYLYNNSLVQLFMN